MPKARERKGRRREKGKVEGEAEGGREKGLASAGERKASDRNGAPESVACLSRRRVCNANSEMKGVSSEAGAALNFWFFSFKRKEQGNLPFRIENPQIWKKLPLFSCIFILTPYLCNDSAADSVLRRELKYILVSILRRLFQIENLVNFLVAE